MSAAPSPAHPAADSAVEPISIWHQSYTALESLPRYRANLTAHHARCGPAGTRLEIHGVTDDAIPAGPGDPVTDAAVRQAARIAQARGFDVVALGCFYDPALQELQGEVRIPVLGACQEAARAARAGARPYALVTLSRPEAELAERMVTGYGCSAQLRGCLVLDPALTEAEIDAASEAEQADVLESFTRSCAHATGLGAELVIPAEGVLAALLAHHQVTRLAGAEVADPFRTLWEAAAAAARSPLGNHDRAAGTSRQQRTAI